MGTVGCVPKASPRKARKPRRPRQERRTLIYKAVESCAIHADLHRPEVDGRLQRYADPEYEPVNQPLVVKKSGATLHDPNRNRVSGSRFLAGEPERVFGVAPTESGVDVEFAGAMSFPGDVVAQFDCGLKLPGRDELEAIGTARSSSTTPGTAGSPSSSFAEARTSRRSPSSRSTRTGWSWRTSPTRSRARASSCSPRTTRSVKLARSTRSIAPPRRETP